MTKKLLVPVTLLLLFALNGKTFSAEKIKGTTGGGWCTTESPGTSWEGALQRLIAHHNAASRGAAVTYTIPVIVHIVYFTTAQNISQAQVNSQITVLNNDYAGIGLNATTTPAPFKAIIANTGITFCLAKLDPNGNVLARPGMDTIKGSSRGFTNPGVIGWQKDYIDGTIKPATIWDPNYYLNIWVVPGIASSTPGQTILGYAVFPQFTGLDGLPETSTEFTDGFVCRSNYFGTVGSASGTYGRTSTHEIGHWLGLRHISGDAVCGDDFVDDTPSPKGGNAGGANGLNFGCPTYPFQVNGCGAGTSPNGEMFMDFMDYTNDNCMSMFSNGQGTRMITALTNGRFRQNVINSPTCDTVLPKPFANFKATQQASSLCIASQTYNFTDKSLFAPTSWSWTFNGGSPASSGSKNPTNIVFNTAGEHAVTLTVTNSKGSSTITKNITVSIIGSGTLPFTEGFEGAAFPPEGWNIVNRNGNASINWDSSRSVGGFGTSSSCMRFDNTTLDALHAKDDIVTPKINLTGISNAKLKFDVAYAPYHDSTQDIYDTLLVLLTTDCEATSTQIYSKGGNTLKTAPGQGTEFYPTASQWRTDSIVLPAAYQNKANVQVIFRNLGNFGHTIYVDNVNLNSPNAIATATASFTASDTTVCSGAGLTFTNTSTASTGSPDSVRWTIPGGVPSTSTSATTVTPVFSTPGTYVISLIAYKGGVASAAATKSIRVKAHPTVGVNSPTICSGQTASLTATGATTYTWTGGLAATATVTTPALTSMTTYTVTGTTSGCTGTAVATVTVNPNPTVGVNSPTICSGTTASLTATGATTYTWTGGLAATATVTTPTLTSTTTYTVTGTASGCTATAVATVTVTPLPNVAVNSSSICSG
ncbi:MAG: Zinc-dependent metalloproteinase lipoprotein family, partial [Bacteroidota bacterium]|nr:Zinc-dependent metalloproteinase lipoprotein family [Bacteroidota bacterium]